MVRDGEPRKYRLVGTHLGSCVTAATWQVRPASGSASRRSSPYDHLVLGQTSRVSASVCPGENEPRPESRVIEACGLPDGRLGSP